MIWINEEDHIRIIYLNEGVDLNKAYTEITTALNSLKKDLAFAYSEKFGYLNSCPTNVGTGLRASLHIILPNMRPGMGLSLLQQNMS